ncbi:hypothetical protein [Chakrabartyella piscis]|uniref:hypothetical protein n=1 Tax=Chakrabartyella piscis TaxID=2918914 RepID=UPI0029589BDE|nr:hypothetical protein [Chakrabartyella piscis]
MKKLVSAVLAGAMVLSMCASALAATTHEASLYKDGEFDPTSLSSNLSMGDDAILDAEVDGDTITVYLQEDFSAYFTTGNLSDVTISGKTVEMIDGDGNGKYDAFSFTHTEDLGDYTKFDADFTINVSIMPIAASGDLVIFG